MEIREALEKAATEAETETSTPAPEAGETTTTEPVSVEAAPEVETETASERARDERGRFAKAQEKAAETAPQGDVHGAAQAAPPAAEGKADGAVTPTSPAPSAEPASPPVRAPQSWTPQAREAFARAPPEVQREVERREREMSRFVNETAPLRQFAQQTQDALRPYETIARANGMDSMTWAGNALQMVASLYAGTPQQRAATIAKAIQMSGADLEAINQALQGQPAAPQTPAVDVNRLIEERFAAMEAQRQEATNREAAQAFLATRPEFIDYVQQDMVELIRIDRARGGNMTPQQAYDRACKLNDEVQSIVAQRKAAEAARTKQQATARAQAAASSVRSAPAAVARTAQPKTLREQMEAADAALSGRV